MLSAIYDGEIDERTAKPCQFREGITNDTERLQGSIGKWMQKSVMG